MVNIQNSSTIKELRKAAGLSISEGFPTNLANSIVPVIEINPEHARICNIIDEGISAATGNTTVFTTPSDQDFFLEGATLTIVKDATCDDADGTLSLDITVNKVAHSILLISKLTLTAINNVISVDFEKPIKLDRSTNIVIGNQTAFTVGKMVKGATIWGYTVEPFES